MENCAKKKERERNGYIYFRIWLTSQKEIIIDFSPLCGFSFFFHRVLRPIIISLFFFVEEINILMEMKNKKKKDEYKEEVVPQGRIREREKKKIYLKGYL